MGHLDSKERLRDHLKIENVLIFPIDKYTYIGEVKSTESKGLSLAIYLDHSVFSLSHSISLSLSLLLLRRSGGLIRLVHANKAVSYTYYKKIVLRVTIVGMKGLVALYHYTWGNII